MSDATPAVFDNRLGRDGIEFAGRFGRPALRRLLAVVGVAIVALVVVLAVDSALLDIDEVTVSGSPHADVDALLAGAGVERGDALITLDLAGVERRLEAMPWVDTAAVERSLPGTLSISITERIPTTIVTAGDRSALVDGSGRVLAIGDTTSMTSEFATYGSPGTAPVTVRATSIDALRAGTELTDVFAIGAALATEVADALPGSVTAVVVDGDELSLELANGATAVLGGTTHLDAKVDALSVMVSRVDMECAATLDLRVPTRPVLTRDTPCS